MKVIKRIEKLDKLYYCPLKSNRLVSNDEHAGHRRVDSLNWSEDELQRGKLVHVREFPKGHRVKLFRGTRPKGPGPVPAYEVSLPAYEVSLREGKLRKRRVDAPASCEAGFARSS